MAILQNDIVRITAKLNVPTIGDFENVFNFRVDNVTPPQGANFVSDCANIIEQVYTLVNPIICSAANYANIGVYVYRGQQTFSPSAWPTLVSGGDANPILTPGSALLSSAASGIARVVARKYWGPMSEQSLINGFWPAPTVAFAQSAMAKAFAQSNGPLGLLLTGVIYNVAGAIARVATASSSSDNPAYQRRRRLGTGI